MTRIFMMAFTLVALTTASGAQGGAPRLSLSPETVMVDEKIEIVVDGLKPGQSVTVRLSSPRGNRVWTSHATFVADSRGRVALSAAKPMSGTYTDVDAMGLFWSASPQPAPAGTAESSSPPPPAPGPLDPEVFELTAEIDGKPVSSAKLIRNRVRPDVKVTKVRDEGLVATLCETGKPGKHPALLVLGGSEGGVPENNAAAFASHGYTALALGYFGVEDLPKMLSDVPLEYVEKGLAWLRRQPGVDPDRIGVFGGSKGAELALLLASNRPEIRAVVVYQPSSVVWQNIAMGAAPSSSWSRGGQPVPYVPYSGDQAKISRYAGDAQPDLGHLYRASLDDPEAVKRAIISVERINGAILLVSGRADRLWPSTYMADMVVDRLRQHAFKHRYQHLAYDDAGHAIRRPYQPTMTAAQGGQFPLGGTPLGYARAAEDSWPKVLKFLEENLRQASARKSP